MASFTEFLSTFDSDTYRRGKQFERFIKWFLKNDPEWATQVEDVWLWDEYPGRWGPDCGIDLVFKSKIGKTWAVQAKCYSADYDISKNDVDTFLSESNRKQIDHRLLIATTDRVGANARQVLDAQEKSVVRCLLSHFESAAVEFPDGIQALSSGKRKPPPELDRPHQIEAIDAYPVFKTLEALPGWSWAPAVDRFEAAWEIRFATLKQFTQREGHTRCAERFIASGEWRRRTCSTRGLRPA